MMLQLLNDMIELWAILQSDYTRDWVSVPVSTVVKPPATSKRDDTSITKETMITKVITFMTLFATKVCFHSTYQTAMLLKVSFT